MYPSRGGSSYGQQQFTPQQGYGQGAASSLRSHPSLESRYGGQYSSVYGTSNANISQQASGMVAVTSSVHGRSGYGSGLGDPPAVMPSSLGSGLGMQTDEYLPSSKYGHNSDHYASMKSDYASGERCHYGDHLAPYMGRDLKTDQGRRYSDSVGLSHQHVSEIQEHMDQASLLRQQQLLKAPSLQVTSDLRMPLATSSLDGSSRQTDYLAARAAAIRNSQDISSYGRIDSDPRNFPVLGNSSYVDLQPPSLLGSAPRRNMDDILHGQGPVGGVYGVGLPPGRDYAASKGLHGSSIDSDYAGCVLSATVRSKSDDRNDERSIFRHNLEIRELDRRREHMHLHERDKEREREREQERRERERERECERERIHERERERERVRKREREREKVRERDRLRRELERERECKRSIELRHERTPSKNTRDHRSCSLVKDERLARKETLTINDVSHRRYFPVRGKRKEYVCKVLAHSLIDFERDYMSISKRYPRLSISPEFSKVVAYWPKSDLVLSIHTPASFEHGLIEECNNTERNLSVKTLVGKPESSNSFTTVWNAKVLLMSGISAEAFAELCADNSDDDRIPHFNNILRFAILRKDRTLMAIGGRWEDAIDGGDPFVEDSALIRAALRYTKDLTQVDLSKCQRWNRFLEIHYDRVGKDGLFSHKEITVLFVPNLSACLPSMDAWRSDWYAVKKTDSEQRQMSQKEKRVNNAEDQKGETIQIKCGKNAEAAKSSRAERKNVCEGKKIAPMVVGDTGNDVKIMTNKLQDDSIDGEDKKICQVEAKTKGEGFVAGTPNIVKRKIVKKVKKIKVGCGGKGKTEINTIVKDETGEGSVKEGAKEVESQGAAGTVGSEDCKLEGVSEKPSRSRKIIRKIAKGMVVHKESKDADDKLSYEAQNESKVPEIAAASRVPNSGVKRTMKRKIIRKVVARKKTPEGEDVSKVVEENQVNEGNGTMDDNTKVPKPLQEQDALIECVASRQDIKIDDESSSAPKKKGDFGKRTASATTTVDMKEKMKSESKDVHMKVSKLLQEQDTVVECGTSTKDIKSGEEGKSASKMKGDSGKKTTCATITVDMKEKVKPVTKDDMSEQRSSRSSNEGQKFEEPPVHPGLFLQTKWTKESKMRSLSLSLDALLDYNDKDFEESTFELSLFAESMYEMLQYQMGSRILEFLEKLRLKFITRRSLKRKENGEIADKDGDGEKQPKRLKHSDDSLVVMEPSVKLEAPDGAKEKESTLTVSEEKLLPDDNSKTGDIEEEPEEDPEEEPEEDPEEDVSEDPEDIGDGNIEDASEEEKNDCEAAILQDEGVDKVTDAIWDKLISWGEGTDNKDEKDKGVNADEKTHVCEGDDPIQKKTDTVIEPVVVNELLQAFRFFDRNRVGYLKVEDLRLIIHNLGKFLSHGDVKELVQSALLESSEGRNNRILYHKLVGQS